MKVAVMQPYLFPYIGYYQMISCIDIFVFYDYVDFPIRGWVNRNQILVNKEAKRFTVPVKRSKLGTPINEIRIADYQAWKSKFLQTISLSYKKSPHYLKGYELIETVLEKESKDMISVLAENSIETVCDYLDIKPEFIRASDIIQMKNESKEAKLDTILSALSATEIVLPPGSVNLYKEWNPKNIVKRTLQLPKISYDQKQKQFINNLSIIDVMMFNDKDEINKMINTKCYR